MESRKLLHLPGKKQKQTHTHFVPTTLTFIHSLGITFNLDHSPHGSICFLGALKIGTVLAHAPVTPHCDGCGVLSSVLQEQSRPANIHQSTTANCIFPAHYTDMTPTVLPSASSSHHSRLKLLLFASHDLGDYPHLPSFTMGSSAPATISHPILLQD